MDRFLTPKSSSSLPLIAFASCELLGRSAIFSWITFSTATHVRYCSLCNTTQRQHRNTGRNVSPWVSEKVYTNQVRIRLFAVCAWQPTWYFGVTAFCRGGFTTKHTFFYVCHIFAFFVFRPFACVAFPLSTHDFANSLTQWQFLSINPAPNHQHYATCFRHGERNRIHYVWLTPAALDRGTVWKGTFVSRWTDGGCTTYSNDQWTPLPPHVWFNVSRGWS